VAQGWPPCGAKREGPSSNSSLFPPPEEALAYPYTPAELRRLEHYRRRQTVGTPEQVKDRLLALAETYRVDELVILTICHDFAARKHSYTLLAEAFGLEACG
jgi:alkanesulfonate monooxygenase SsuD/methylene tetrahydromethanopterin reductase-like flavin-dependent oxidoreductase (luciferase family)